MTVEQMVSDIRSKIANTSVLNYGPLLTELEKLGITLDEDPTSIGLSKLNVKIAQIDAQKTRAGNILMKAIKNESVLTNLQKNTTMAYKIHRAEVLALPDIAELKNQQLRDAGVERALRPLAEVQEKIDRLVDDAKTFTRLSQNKFSDLDSTNKNISRQLTVIQTQVEIGEIERRYKQQNDDF